MRADWYPKPRLETKFKVRWDDTKLYVGAYVEDKDLWGTITAADAGGNTRIIVYPLTNCKPLNGYFGKQRLPRCGISSGSALFAKKKSIFSDNGI